MLSICIPLYNYDIRDLVKKLVFQIENTNYNIELILGDDRSSDKEVLNLNKEIENFPQVTFYRSPSNVGRAAIRNRIAGIAKYQYILFLDCDSDIQSNFLNNYLSNVNLTTEVICGGTLHPSVCPSSKQSLRWKAGKVREDIKAKERMINPYNSFTSNNFLIKKELFDLIKFNEKIRKYGHEDTLFGINLEIQKTKIQHIDNPAIHLGIDFNEEYIQKSQSAIENIVYIMQHSDYNQELLNRITLLKYYARLKKYYLNNIIRFLYYITKPLIISNLKGQNPNLVVFDLFKLGHLSTIDK